MASLDHPTVTVVMPAVRDDAAFREALAAIGRCEPAPDQLVIACPGSDAAVVTAAQQAGADIVQLPPGGPAMARNAAVKRATSDVVLFVDSDVAVHPDIVAKTRAVLADRSIAALVGVYDDRPPAPNFVSQYKNLLQRFVHLQARVDGQTFWGACGALRRDVFDSVGGFDERFTTPSVEDIELGYRVKAAGHRILFSPLLEVTHLKRWTALSLLRSDIFRRAIPWTWLLVRESGIAPDLNVTVASRVTSLLALTVPLALLAALKWPALLVVAAVALALFVVMERKLARFFAARRGWWFAARGLAWHLFYYLYSVAAFAAGMVTYPIWGKRMTGPGVR